MKDDYLKEYLRLYADFKKKMDESRVTITSGITKFRIVNGHIEAADGEKVEMTRGVERLVYGEREEE